jgi:uncharacterized protein YciW
MPADMADLPDYPGSVNLTNTQRLNAALSLAEAFEDKRVLAYYLVALGLAEHCSDGRFTAVADRDEFSWFSPRDHRSQPTFSLPVGHLDDCR